MRGREATITVDLEVMLKRKIPPITWAGLKVLGLWKRRLTDQIAGSFWCIDRPWQTRRQAAIQSVKDATARWEAFRARSGGLTKET